MRKVIYTFLLLFFTTCNNSLISEPNSPYYPPSIYNRWRDEIRECALTTTPVNNILVSNINWYVVKGDQFMVDGYPAVGAYFFKSQTIYISEKMVDTAWVVKHELLHALTGIRNHPYIPFNTCHVVNIDH